MPRICRLLTTKEKKLSIQAARIQKLRKIILYFFKASLTGTRPGEVLLLFYLVFVSLQKPLSSYRTCCGLFFPRIAAILLRFHPKLNSYARYSCHHFLGKSEILGKNKQNMIIFFKLSSDSIFLFS